MPAQVAAEVGGGVGLALDREHPQAGGQAGTLGRHRPRAGADIPQDAGGRKPKLPEGDGPHLGLGDHPVPMTVGGLGPTPGPRRPRVGRRGRGRRRGTPPRTGHRSGPTASPAVSPLHTCSSGSPSRLATVTSRSGRPGRAAPGPPVRAVDPGEVNTATLSWARMASTAALERPPVGGHHHGVVPGQPGPGAGQGHRRRGRVHGHTRSGTGPGPAGPARRSRGRRRPPRTPFHRSRARLRPGSSTSSRAPPKLDPLARQLGRAGRARWRGAPTSTVASARARRAAAPNHSPPSRPTSEIDPGPSATGDHRVARRSRPSPRRRAGRRSTKRPQAAAARRHSSASGSSTPGRPGRSRRNGGPSRWRWPPPAPPARRRSAGPPPPGAAPSTRERR